MSAQESLEQAYAAILANPDDDAPRVRYAEIAGGDRAEFIRKGISLRNVRRMGGISRADAEAMRAVASIQDKHPEWGADVIPLVDAFEYGRGFVERVTLSAAGFLERAPIIFAKAPVIHATLTSARGLCEALAASPYMERLRSLDLRRNKLGDAGVIALAGSPHFR